MTCSNYIKEHFQNKNTTKSLYLQWLKGKLPSSIQSIKLIDKKKVNNSFSYELIKTRINDSEVIFFKTLDPEKEKEFGAISITEINGMSVVKLFSMEY